MEREYYFSPETNLFYPVSLAALYKEKGTLPEKLHLVDKETFFSFLPENKPTGKQVGSNKAGKPCWVSEKPMTKKEHTQWATSVKERLLQEAEAIINLLERSVKLGISTDEEKALLTSWEKYSVILNRIDTSSEHIDWPEKPQ
ncbi:tail fiber assembly protein [Pantoea stewartii]|uniref:tail fiber assembly protein n=1 Tax=Pantoea stewartii TaxID=66269 RepID=UPI00139054A6|nr:tail fiber assembly protein [Pantoea stewartii]